MPSGPDLPSWISEVSPSITLATPMISAARRTASVALAGATIVNMTPTVINAANPMTPSPFRGFFQHIAGAP